MKLNNKDFNVLTFNHTINSHVDVTSINYDELNIGMINHDMNDMITLRIGKAMINKYLLEDLSKLFEVISNASKTQ